MQLQRERLTMYTWPKRRYFASLVRTRYQLPRKRIFALGLLSSARRLADAEWVFIG